MIARYARELSVPLYADESRFGVWGVETAHLDAREAGEIHAEAGRCPTAVSENGTSIPFDRD